MSELLQNIDMNAAVLLFLRIVLVLIATVSGVLGPVAILMAFDPDSAVTEEETSGYVKFGVVLILICIGAVAILFGGLP